MRHLWTALTILLAGLFAAAPALMPAPAAAADSAKDLYTKYKCQNCHSIVAEGIEVEEDPDAEEPEEGEPEPPDLSGVGLEHDKKWIAKYLLKQIEYEDRKHKKKFQGEMKELAALASWLETLKTEPAE